MNNAISEKLLSHIKTILSDEPLDIYFEFSESYSTSIVELVNSRSSEFQKTVGSANMLIASSILNYELTELGLQEEDYSDVFAENWHKVIETLKEQGFLRDTPETVRERIYLAVDNATPIEGCKNSCLNKGENNDECTIE